MKLLHCLLSGIMLSSSHLGMGCAVEDAPEAADGEVDIVTIHEALTGVQSGDYKFPATLDEEISPINKTDLWARIYAPSPLEEGKRYPVLVFQHGIHGSCGDTSTVPRTDSGDRYIFTGECYEGHVVVPNHAGYGYIADEMAARGYIIVSVNASRGIVKGSGYEGQARGRLLLKHLEKLAHWDQGREPTPPELGFDLQGHVDFTEVGLMGHSRGGIAVRWAHKLAKEDTIDWTARLGAALTIRSIFEIAPIDARLADPVGVPVAVLLPMCDGSVSNLEGVKFLDRSMGLEMETPGVFRATVAVYGTNHNYYNTEWQHSDSSSREDSRTCVGQTPLFDSQLLRYAGWYTEGVTGSEAQREVGKQLVTRFFLATVGPDRDPSKAALFDPRNDIPSEITDITPIDRGFTPSSYFMDRIEFEDFQGETGIGRWGEPAWINGINVDYTALFQHDPSYRGAHITWNSAAVDNVFEPRLTKEGQGVNLQHFDTLDFRVDPTDDPELNVADILNFAVQLVDGNGAVSHPVDVSDYVTLSGRERTHSMLQTVRIPLGDFGNQIPLTHIRGVRFSFDDTPSGSIYLASIRANKGGIPEAPPTASIDVPTNFDTGKEQW